MSNLPPGVTDSMIPGNRPEDAEWEKFADGLAEWLSAYGVDMAEVDDDASETFATIASDLWELVLANRSEIERA